MLQLRPLKQLSCFNGFSTHPPNYKSPIKSTKFVSKINAIKASGDLDFVTFTLIVDDLVFWDGETKMGQLGGGGPQTAWGYQTVASLLHCKDGDSRRTAGLAAGVGPDVPFSCLEWLESIGVDISGIQKHQDAKTPRAWQILEQDGRRHEVSRY
jgi:hypothetical protein